MLGRKFGVGLGVVFAMTVSAAAWAQGTPGPSGPAAEVQRAYSGLKTNILKAANNMPDDSYSYKPTPDIRTFARVVNHVTEAQSRACGAANGAGGSAPPVPSETAGKAAIVSALQASFAECDKAFASLTDSNATEMLSLGQVKRSRLGLMWGTVSHDNEQYATLALYMRLKGLTRRAARSNRHLHGVSVREVNHGGREQPGIDGGRNILSVESVSDTVYSVEGHNFVAGFRVEVRDGVGRVLEGVTVAAPSGTAFRLTLPYATPGPYTVLVVNPDGRTSTAQFATPGTSASNTTLRIDS